MRPINTIKNTQLTETEIIIYLMINNGASYRYLAKYLGVNVGSIQNTYNNAEKKFAAMGDLFKTEVSPVDN